MDLLANAERYSHGLPGSKILFTYGLRCIYRGPFFTLLARTWSLVKKTPVTISEQLYPGKEGKQIHANTGKVRENQ